MVRVPLLRRFRTDETGAALVEFALVFPVLLVFFAFVVLFGHMLFTYQKAVEGVRDASRYLARVAAIDGCLSQPGGGSLSGTWGDKVTAIIRDDIHGNSLFPTNVTLDAVVPSFVCTSTSGVAYRTNPAPVAVVSATFTISLPMAGLFGLFGGVPSSLTTTIVQKSRIYGA
jgi:Flp pilus assembly pilin Flp